MSSTNNQKAATNGDAIDLTEIVVGLRSTSGERCPLSVGWMLQRTLDLRYLFRSKNKEVQDAARRALRDRDSLERLYEHSTMPLDLAGPQ